MTDFIINSLNSPKVYCSIIEKRSFVTLNLRLVINSFASCSVSRTASQVFDSDSGSGTPVESDVKVDEDNNHDRNDSLEQVKEEVEKEIVIENQT